MTIEEFRALIAILAILVGTFFSLVGLLGMVRLPDAYTRLHATGKVGIYGAVLLLVYWLPFTLIVYSFWDDAPEYKRVHALYFMRNLALCGGLFLLIANGAGKYSVKRLIYIMKLPR